MLPNRIKLWKCVFQKINNKCYSMLKIIDTPAIQTKDDGEFDLNQMVFEEKGSVLNPTTEFNENEFLPYSKPSFNLAAYVNSSESLQKLIKLGVDLHKLEKRKGIGQFVLQLDFERDIKNHLLFLSDVGVPSDLFGEFITKNPLIFKEDLDDLQVRIQYLQSKKFKSEQISRVVSNNPYWLMYNTKRIDQRLGFFQETFKLVGNDVRTLSVKQPRLITYNLQHIQKNTFSIQEEMGFEKHEVKELLLRKPKLWMLSPEGLMDRFDYVHRKMQISHKQILESPEILTSRLFRIKQRHLFLRLLGKNQYDTKKDLYISLKSVAEGDDKRFVFDVAKSNMEIYDNFLKTL